MTATAGPPLVGAAAIVPGIVERHAGEAAFLWSLRDAATDQPHYTLGHLATLEARIEAHIDGLRVAKDAGFKIACANLDRVRGPDELFVVATLALESRAETRIEFVLDFAEAVPGSRRGLFGALGWVMPETLRGRVVSWLDAPSTFRRLAGVVACSLHRADPGPSVERLLGDEPSVRARTLRLAGELGRIDLRQRVASALGEKDEACRFWAAWAAGLLGDRVSPIPVLKTCAAGDSRFQLCALEILVKLLDCEAAAHWLREFGCDPAHGRLLIIATGVLGDPVAVRWLIENMGIPALARVAGESFSMITGTDLAEEALDGPAPVGFTASPDDQARDENLPWPDPAKVEAWWQNEEMRFPKSVRHLRGLPLAGDACNKILRDGRQRQRRAAAYGLALISPGQHLWNWRARSEVQARRLRVPTPT